jgi:hypothetical protein
MPATLPLALIRQTIHVRVNRAEMMALEAKAKETNMSVANYVRTVLGLPERTPGRPSADQLEREQDEAWNLLQGIGVDPAAYFPDDDSWLDSYR